ncbi:RNA degradosome polyphosphate kinase [Marinilactibacillus sp. 15R]|uniref:polyphosphate kinase 1 n=1 Tax=Marinilactibacillus sp. 15R TaxID=1911586 RepID=UPI00090BB6A7|nr:polyphosphate kinase 1 [Marinilactibacillus sp. 15R]API87996.1 RNA degradosome polyphosphate kinase [Marinilactibacillus sp. 15R]
MQYQSIDLHNPKYYQNRELSWLDFNERVLAEVEDSTNPLLEKLTFLSIGSSNSDEFFKVRVAGLQDQLKLGVDETDTKKQWSPEKQLEEISKRNKDIVRYQYDLYNQKLAELAEKNILFKHIEDLNESELHQTADIFRKHIKPAITPFGVDAYRPFPHLNDGVIHLFVRLKKSGSPFIAILPVPLLIERFHILEENDKKIILFTEEILFKFLNELFTGYNVEYSFTFRITRNADLELQEEGADDLLSVIEDYLLKRKNGRAVRLEVDVRTASYTFKEDVTYLMEELDLLKRDVYEISGPLDLTVLSDIASQLKPTLLTESFQKFTPEYPSILNKQTVYELSEKQDIFLHHPFDSFQPVIDLVRQAVEDPNTIAIKQTLYRVSDESPFIEALKKAARKDIQVTVLVELKARFDEANNVHWAKELEESGAHILYGIKNLKTHSKATLIVKKDHRGFKRYAHLGTGNYNEQTARLYTDMGIITTNEKLTQDVADFFNYLSGYSKQPIYNYLHVSPFEMRDSFIDNIEKEITLHKHYGNGHIIAKMNSLTDKKMIIKLFKASQAGVKVDLIIRGICCLIPGIPGVSENIKVHSIVGRFLEHSRVYYFYQNGNKELYLSSADMMTRNMIKRVELAFPIIEEKWKKYVINILKLYMYDNTKAWILGADGRYTKAVPNNTKPISSQHQLINYF